MAEPSLKKVVWLLLFLVSIRRISGVITESQIKADNSYHRYLPPHHQQTNCKYTSSRPDNPTTNWTHYQQLSTNYKWLKNLSFSFPEKTKLHFIGKSAENRDIIVFNINPLANKVTSDNPLHRRPIIFIEAGLNGNDWIASATATYIIDQLLTSKNRHIEQIANLFEWYILPHANPDGYEYSLNIDRLWRKNRRKVDKWCHGVDLNRNFMFQWENREEGNKVCSNTYPGPMPFSEPETRALFRFVSTLKSIDLYISLQGFSQKLVYPNGYNSDHVPNRLYLQTILNATIKGLKERYGTIYSGGNMYDAVHPVPGNSMDSAYSIYGVNLTFTFMLRPPYGSRHEGDRTPPASQILPTALETLDALIAMIVQIQYQGYFTQRLYN